LHIHKHTASQQHIFISHNPCNRTQKRTRSQKKWRIRNNGRLRSALPWRGTGCCCCSSSHTQAACCCSHHADSARHPCIQPSHARPASPHDHPQLHAAAVAHQCTIGCSAHLSLTTELPCSFARRLLQPSLVAAVATAHHASLSLNPLRLPQHAPHAAAGVVARVRTSLMSLPIRFDDS
jgi:hypothetical protein